MVGPSVSDEMVLSRAIKGNRKRQQHFKNNVVHNSKESTDKTIGKALLWYNDVPCHWLVDVVARDR